MAAVLLVGCGQGPSGALPVASPTREAALSPGPQGPTPSSAPPISAAASPTRTSVPLPSSSLLFAVVEGQTPTGGEANTVAIVGMDGYARAKAQFTPRQRPFIGNAAVPLQAAAQVVGSSVYYIDGYGTVRSLRAGGQPQTVASFSTQPVQYETWFAVSPDGASAIAGIMQFPGLGTPPSPCEGLTCMPPLVGPWSFRLVSAKAGGAAVVLQHYESANPPDSQTGGWHPTFPVAWIQPGPIAMVPVGIATQNAWWGGPLYLLDAAGQRVRQFGGTDCNSESIAGGQFIPCTGPDYKVTVRDQAGDVLWTSQVDGFNALGIRVSPDGQSVTDGTKVETRSGALITLPVGFIAEGWLDNGTVVGWSWSSNGQQRSNLSWISLSDPATIHDLGFKGDFIGTLT